MKLRFSSIKTLNYRVGQFVRSGSIFLTYTNGNVLTANHDFLLLSYKLQRNTLVCTRISLRSTFKSGPARQAHTDYLIRAFEKGKLDLSTYRKHGDTYARLTKDSVNVAHHVNVLLKENSPPLLQSITLTISKTTKY